MSDQIPALATEPRLLDVLADELRRGRLVEGRIPAAQLIYLALHSRHFERPASVVVKGSSAGGKSWVLEQALRFHPADAYQTISTFSEKALVHGKADIRHRFLVILEAEGMASEFGNYIIRTLLSEGQIRYEWTDPNTFEVATKVRPGPTGLLTTTTGGLHPENETRLLSVAVSDGPSETREVLRAWGAQLEAGGPERIETDYAPWHALARWLGQGPRDVAVPFGRALGELASTNAVRVRRDFITATTLMRAHALLHRATRERNAQGQIVATLEDFEVVRQLVDPILAQALDLDTSPEVREMVALVEELQPSYPKGVRQTELAKRLGIDGASVSRRVARAVDEGWLRKHDPRRVRNVGLLVDEAVPTARRVLPTVEELSAALASGPPRAESCKSATKGRTNDRSHL